MKLSERPITCISSYRCEFQCKGKYIGYGGKNFLGVVEYNFESKKKCNIVKQITHINTLGFRVEKIVFASKLKTKGRLMIGVITNENSVIIYQFDKDLKKIRIVNFFDSEKIGHSHGINSLSFLYLKQGIHIATVSNDQSLRIHSLESSKLLDCINFSSNVTSVCPNSSPQYLSSETPSILIGEEKGIVYTYDIYNNSIINKSNSKNLNTGRGNKCYKTKVDIYGELKSPLYDVSVNPNNEKIIGAVGGKNFFVWDQRKMDVPILSALCHEEGARYFSWSVINESMFATASGKSSVKIFDVTKGEEDMCILYEKQKYKVGGLDWIYGDFIGDKEEDDKIEKKEEEKKNEILLMKDEEIKVVEEEDDEKMTDIENVFESREKKGINVCVTGGFGHLNFFSPN